MGKYSPLRDFLLGSGRSVVRLSFSEIESIIGGSLPMSAFKYREWWANDKYHVQARDGWLAAGYSVTRVDLEDRIVVFTKQKRSLGTIYSMNSGSKGNIFVSSGKLFKNAREFEEYARLVMSRYFGVKLRERGKPGWPKSFDLVSPDYRIVGDAKYYSMVKRKWIPPAKFSTIAEHVWFLEKIDADIKFLVFGNDKRVPTEWLKRYGYLVYDIKFYFIHDNGTIEELK